MGMFTRKNNSKRKNPLDQKSKNTSVKDIAISGPDNSAANAEQDDTSAKVASVTPTEQHGAMTSAKWSFPETEYVEVADPKKDKSIYCEQRITNGQSPSFIFTHGAGGGLETPAMQTFGEGFSSISSIISFKGNMNLISRVRSFHVVTSHIESNESDTRSGFSTMALGGRSMGARAAVLAVTPELETETPVAALVLVSYPLVAGGKGDNQKNDDVRTQILLDLPDSVDVLFISGSRDAQGPLARLSDVRQRMGASSWMVVVENADHGMSWKGKAKQGEQEMRRQTGMIAASWLQKRDQSKRFRSVRWDEDAAKVVAGGWYKDEKHGRNEVDSGKDAGTAEPQDEAEEKEGDENQAPPPAKRRRKAR